ncbi:MAG TPA: substrate-binding domain-containing protein, partial [Polyangiaceae bacterium]|nr:substrate-binding domain-containing protein [Polyangiaceae bacterium]
MGSPAASRRPRIGLLVDALYNEYSEQLLSAFEVESARHQVDLICFAGGILQDLGHERMRNIAFELVTPAAVDAVACLSLSCPVEVQASFLAGLAPMPVCGIAVDTPGNLSVGVDSASGTKEALRHLYHVHGRRQISCLSGPSGNQDAMSRLEAYREALEEFGLLYDPRLVVEGGFNEAQGYEATNVLLRERKLSIDALIAGNDFAAYGALRALREFGLTVPNDVSLVGFDDSDLGRGSTPSIATVRQPYFEQASAAIELLRARLEGRETETRVRLPSQFIRRRSCGCMSEGAPSEAPPLIEAIEGSFDDNFAALRPKLLAELTWAEMASRMLPEPGWAPRFLDELQLVLQGKGDAELLAAFESVLLATISVSGDLVVWHQAASGLRRHILPCVMRTPTLWLRLENVWQRLRVLITDAVEREQRNLRLLAERSAGILTDTSESLITSFNVDTLPKALAEKLPALEIPSAYIALYEDQAAPLAGARLIVAYEHGALQELPSAGLPFKTVELLPERFRGGERRALVVEALFFEGRHLGFALFELGAKRRIVCELLRELVSAALQGADLVRRVAEEASQREKAQKERLEQELSIATHIQTSILPRDLAVPGLAIAAAMIPATEVGGDYYDVLLVEGGCWIGIGDVAGHGLRPGLVMMMLQSVVSTVGRHSPNAPPSELIGVVNAVLYDNIRQRLGQDEHATLSLMRYSENGELVFAGAHEDLIIRRART